MDSNPWKIDYKFKHIFFLYSRVIENVGLYLMAMIWNTTTPREECMMYVVYRISTKQRLLTKFGNVVAEIWHKSILFLDTLNPFTLNQWTSSSSFLNNLFMLQSRLGFVGYHFTATPAGIYSLKDNNSTIRTICKICSMLTIKTPERRHWRRSCVFIVNFEHISHFVLVILH